MPFTLNGIGTMYYGNRDRTVNGSYITTKYFVVVYLPIFPIASYQIRPVGQSTNLIFYNSTNYFAERVPLCWSQVRNLYAVTGSILGLLAALLIGPAIATIPLTSLMITVLLLYAIAFFLFLKPKTSPAPLPLRFPSPLLP